MDTEVELWNKALKGAMAIFQKINHTNWLWLDALPRGIDNES